MVTNTSPASEPPPGPSTDPEEELRKKQRDLQEVQTEIVKDTQSANSLQADIKALQAKIAEVKQLLGGYKPDKLQSDLDETNKVITTKLGIAEAALKDKKAAVDTAINEFYDKLKLQAEAVTTALTNSTAADGEAKTAEDAAQAAQRSYEDVKKIPDKFDTWSKDIKDLLDQASKMETQSDYVALYFLAGEARKVAEQFNKLPIQLYDDFKKLLDAKLSESQSARENANVKRAEAGQLLNSYNAKKTDYDTAYASRRTTLLKKLDKLKTGAEKK